MFTGLVEALGVLARRTRQRDAARVLIQCDLGALELGESVAVNGVCLTVDRAVAGGFEADLSSETLARTTLGAMPLGARVHLERAMPLGGRMGGHVVTGHVDGLGEVVAREALGTTVHLTIRAARDLAPFLAAKGSITVDGVSLTVNTVADAPDGTRFDVMLVPHTLARTALGALVNGAKVNLEVDVLARYVARQLELGARSSAPGAEEGTRHEDDDRDARLLTKLRDGGFT